MKMPDLTVECPNCCAELTVPVSVVPLRSIEPDGTVTMHITAETPQHNCPRGGPGLPIEAAS